MPASERTLKDLLEEVRRLFEQQMRIDSLLSLSKQFQVELKQHLISSPQCMLPSFNYTLPTGKEQGTYLALEVGGSNLRMGLVELRGRSQSSGAIRIRHNLVFPITNSVRKLQEYAFFDWMAERIGEMIALDGDKPHRSGVSEPLRMGVAWSFPIDQTSVKSGNVLGMGKGFHCSDTVKGHDLGDMISRACQRADLNIRLDAIVNDSSSALLARAYLDPATRLACILGTGMNAAIHLPIASLHPSKFASRSLPKGTGITHVLTNTESSMYGKKIFLTTRWDELLNSRHILPDYQPSEYLIAGGYMGEIVRLIMVEATKKAGLFQGSLPRSLESTYALDTKTLAEIELDDSDTLVKSRTYLHTQHPSVQPPGFEDAYFIRQIVCAVTSRSIAFFTVGIHALSSLLQDMENKAGLKDGLDHITIGCDGSVINKYPGYMDRAQDTLNKMLLLEKQDKKRVILEKTQDSAVLGAGVAGAMTACSPNAS